MNEIEKHCEESKTFLATFKEKIVVSFALCALAYGGLCGGMILKTQERQSLLSTAGISEVPTDKTSFHSLIKIEQKRVFLLHINVNICCFELRSATSPN